MSATRPCPQCGTANPEAARFCAQCGATIATVAPPPVAVAPPPAAVSLTEARPPGFGMKTVVGIASVPDATPRSVAAAPPAQPAVAPPPQAVAAPPPAAFASAPEPTPAPPQAAPAAAPGGAQFRGMKTMIGGAAAFPPPQGGVLATAPTPLAVDIPSALRDLPVAPSGGKLSGTMIGMPAASLLPSQPAAPSPRAAGDNRTMIGVAMPGIAPSAASAPVHTPPPENKTMLGVALPGIAPLRAGEAPMVAPTPSPSRPQRPVPAIVPAPPPLLDESLPPPPVKRVARRGVPLAAVAGAGLVLVLAVGVAVVVFWKGGPALLVQPRLAANGKEQLHLVCESCADGTTASLGGAKSTFAAHETDLDLATPLKLGDNPVEIALDRPGVGRDESVSAVVPVSYRVRADLADIGADPPVIDVRVEAVTGTKVRVEGADVALDAQGHGTHVVSLAADTQGPSDEGHVIERTIAYEVERQDKNAKGGVVTEKGAVAARVGVIPLRVDAPTSQGVTEAARVWVAGRTSKGGSATVNGKPADMTPTGAFSLAVDVPLGETSIDVRATAPQVAARSVHLVVHRVEHLDVEAKAREATSPLTYDAIAADVAGNAGKPVALEGSVLEARGQNHQTVIVLNDKRGCAKGPCVARVVHGEDDTLKAGDVVRAYGRVTRAVSTTDGKTVPEIEADLLVRGKGP